MKKKQPFPGKQNELMLILKSFGIKNGKPFKWAFPIASMQKTTTPAGNENNPGEKTDKRRRAENRRLGMKDRRLGAVDRRRKTGNTT